MFLKDPLDIKPYGEIKRLNRQKSFSVFRITVGIISLLAIVFGIYFLPLYFQQSGVNHGKITNKGFMWKTGLPDRYYFEVKNGDKTFSVNVDESIYNQYEIGEDYYTKK